MKIEMAAHFLLGPLISDFIRIRPAALKLKQANGRAGHRDPMSPVHVQSVHIVRMCWGRSSLSHGAVAGCKDVRALLCWAQDAGQRPLHDVRRFASYALHQRVPQRIGSCDEEMCVVSIAATSFCFMHVNIILKYLLQQTKCILIVKSVYSTKGPCLCLRKVCRRSQHRIDRV
jgi:hypothetical protein